MKIPTNIKRSLIILAAGTLVAFALMTGSRAVIETEVADAARCSHSCSFTAAIGASVYSVVTTSNHNCRRDGWPSWGCANLQNEAVPLIAAGYMSHGWAVGCGNYHSFVATVLTPPPVHGSCGWVNGDNVTYPPEENSGYCARGTRTGGSWDGEEYSWTCSGSNGGSSANCSLNTEEDSGSCSKDADCDSGKKCLSSRCVQTIKCPGAIPCPNGTCPIRGMCVPNESFVDFSLKPGLVEKATDKCLATWKFDEMQTNGQAVVCTIKSAGGYNYTATSTTDGSRELPVGNYSLTCTVAEVSETEAVACRQIPRFEEF